MRITAQVHESISDKVIKLLLLGTFDRASKIGTEVKVSETWKSSVESGDKAGRGESGQSRHCIRS